MDKIQETSEKLDYIYKNVSKLRKEYIKELKKETIIIKKKEKQVEENAYYLSPVKVSNDFIQFFKLLPEHQYSRIFCYRKVFEYLKKHQLLTLEEITISSDIECIFKTNKGITLRNLATFLEWHFEPQN